LINKSFFTPERIAELNQSFNQAKPYRHLVIDGLINQEQVDYMYTHFPVYDLFNKKYKGLNEFKAEGSNFQDFDPIFAKLRDEIASKEFCEWLSQVSGIKDIYSVPDALGAGLHQGSNGSFLDVHIDFNIHVDQNIHRRINLLIFFNKDWKEEFGGGTELWNADMTVCDKKVLPLHNRCLIFETNEISYHGYDKIKIPEDITRKSFYTYFYTDLRADAVSYHDTVFKARPTDGQFKKTITPIKEKAKNLIKAGLKKIGITLG
ncbi:MAG: 2OG-Fe(II) oxygenase, partial [Bacteroidetes bacterium]|nr:2OG-Fe(II) oxygenase [Bacteroidota bacterium]